MQPKGIDLDAAGNINGLPVIEVDLDSFEDKPWRKPGGASQVPVVNILCSFCCLFNFTCNFCLLIAAREQGRQDTASCSASGVCLDNQLIDQATLIPNTGLHLLLI